MKSILLVVFLSLCIAAAGRERHSHTAKPTTLEETYAALDGIFNDTSAYSFMMMPEQIAVSRLHMGLGMWIRNNWGLWRNSDLAQYFVAKGVEHPDDMSGIILTSYHRYLNKKPVDLEGQIRQNRQGHTDMDSVFAEEVFGNRASTDSALMSLFPISDTILLSIYAKYRKHGRMHGSGLSATAVVKEHRGEKLLIQIVAMKDEAGKTPDRKVGEIYEERPYNCSLLPPRNWHRQ